MYALTYNYSVPQFISVIIYAYYRIAEGLTIRWDILQQTLCKLIILHTHSGELQLINGQSKGLTLKGKYNGFTNFKLLILCTPSLINFVKVPS